MPNGRYILSGRPHHLPVLFLTLPPTFPLSDPLYLSAHLYHLMLILMSNLPYNCFSFFLLVLSVLLPDPVMFIYFRHPSDTSNLLFFQ